MSFTPADKLTHQPQNCPLAVFSHHYWRYRHGRCHASQASSFKEQESERVLNIATELCCRRKNNDSKDERNQRRQLSGWMHGYSTPIIPSCYSKKMGLTNRKCRYKFNLVFNMTKALETLHLAPSQYKHVKDNFL